MNEVKYCPKCENPLVGYPALSRVDNKTEVCSDCGLQEAIEAVRNDNKTLEEILKDNS